MTDDSLPEEFRARMGVMTEGFKDQMGTVTDGFRAEWGRPLRPALKKRALRKYVDAHSSPVTAQDIDIEAFITEDQRFSEDLDDLLNAYPLGRDLEEMDRSELENELEKYRALAQRHGFELDT